MNTVYAIMYFGRSRTESGFYVADDTGLTTRLIEATTFDSLDDAECTEAHIKQVWEEGETLILEVPAFS